jgi:hypothetical protein
LNAVGGWEQFDGYNKSLPCIEEGIFRLAPPNNKFAAPFELRLYND